MTAYTSLKLHLEAHKYTKGANKGDAPADASRRGKTHFLVIKRTDSMVVRMHATDIITAYEDGRIVLNTNGWHDSPTTRQCMNTALRQFVGYPVSIGGVRFRNYSQTSIFLLGKKYRYYDGIELSAEGDLLTPPKAYSAKVTDREETAEFRKDINESGFVGVFPVLYAAADVPTHSWMASIKEKVCNEHCAEWWPEIVSLIKFPGYRAQQTGTPHYNTANQALRAFIAHYTKNMTKHVDTDVFVL